MNITPVLRQKQNRGDFSMIRRTEFLCVFLAGGVIYSCLELFWRGYTHWSMTIAGGICLLGLHLMNGKRHAWHILARCLAGCFLITAVEFIIGVIVNLVFRLNVWDYSDQPFSFMGQICPGFFVLWFLLVLPVIIISDTMQKSIFGDMA